jgi:hypothetical protein
MAVRICAPMGGCDSVFDSRDHYSILRTRNEMNRNQKASETNVCEARPHNHKNISADGLYERLTPIFFTIKDEVKRNDTTKERIYELP